MNAISAHRYSKKCELVIGKMTQVLQRKKRIPEVDSVIANLGKRTLVMGILNVTPDSFSDGGKYNQVDRGLAHAHSMVESGADLIDVGAESTRPDHLPVSAQEEWERLDALLPALRAEIPIPLSIDTYKAEVAWRAVASGVDIINDVWGGVYDPEMFDIVAQTGVPYILMHNTMGLPQIEEDIVDAVYRFFTEQMNKAIKAGVKRQQIILDPGVGFGKTVPQNLQLINRLDAFLSLGQPLLIGTSRKSVIGSVLNLPVNERIEGTAATVAIAIARGADIVRVHDVKEIVRVVKMTDSMVR